MVTGVGMRTRRHFLSAVGAGLASLPLPGQGSAGLQGEFPGRAWPVAPPEEAGLRSAAVADAVRFLAARAGSDGARELAIVRNGLLVWSGEAIDKVHGVWSMTKSFTSTCLGLLIAKGKCSLDTRAADVHPALAARYGEVTLRHFTTMTSGYRAEGDEPRPDGYRHGPSRTPFAPSPQPLFAPGTRYAYWDSAMNELGFLLTRIAGEPLEALFAREVAGPIGMEPSGWRWGDLGIHDGHKVNGGAGNHGAHIFLSARAALRFGWLFLREGHWNGREVVPADWVRQATTVQVPAATPCSAEGGAEGAGVYGFNWWVNGVMPNGHRKWPAAPEGTFAASGFNNNDLFVVPAWNLVVARLGLDQRTREITDADYSEFLGMLGAAALSSPTR